MFSLGLAQQAIQIFDKSASIMFTRTFFKTNMLHFLLIDSYVYFLNLNI